MSKTFTSQKIKLYYKQIDFHEKPIIDRLFLDFQKNIDNILNVIRSSKQSIEQSVCMRLQN